MPTASATRLPPVAEAIARHVEESHARHMAAIPLRRPADPNADDAALPKSERRRSNDAAAICADRRTIRFARRRIAARLAGGSGRSLLRPRLYNALEVRSHAAGLAAAAARQSERSRRGARAAHGRSSLAAIAGGIAALVIVPADFNVEAPGTLQPVVRRDVFAPRSGIVDEVLVKHGADVKAGAAARADARSGARAGTEARRRRTGNGPAAARCRAGDAEPTAAAKRRRSNRIGSRPKSASCSRSWRIRAASSSCSSTSASSWSSPARSRDACSRGTLAINCLARPVERGEVLVTVADLSADWQLELDVPDRSDRLRAGGTERNQA